MKFKITINGKTYSACSYEDEQKFFFNVDDLDDEIIEMLIKNFEKTSDVDANVQDIKMILPFQATRLTRLFKGEIIGAMVCQINDYEITLLYDSLDYDMTIIKKEDRDKELEDNYK